MLVTAPACIRSGRKEERPQRTTVDIVQQISKIGYSAGSQRQN